jgi:putative membrane protein
MSSEAQSILLSWSSPLWMNVVLCLSALAYLRGWLRLRSVSGLIPIWRMMSFFCGLLALWVAIGSPLEAFDDVSLAAHMVQHLLLMLAVPPLVLLGSPWLPLLQGLPQWMVRGIAGPILRWIPGQRLGYFATQPVVGLLSATIALVVWHVPAAFELALHSTGWHEFEHFCFLTTSLLFWWPIVQPFPARARWPQWAMPLYLFFGMLPSGAVGAFLTFYDRVVYPSYEASARVFGTSPLQDQIFAGVLMWVAGTFVCLLPAVVLTVRLLSPESDQLQGPGIVGQQRNTQRNVRVT